MVQLPCHNFLFWRRVRLNLPVFFLKNVVSASSAIAGIVFDDVLNWDARLFLNGCVLRGLPETGTESSPQPTTFVIMVTFVTNLV